MNTPLLIGILLVLSPIVFGCLIYFTNKGWEGLQTFLITIIIPILISTMFVLGIVLILSGLKDKASKEYSEKLELSSP